jgi:hypothetical protein
MFQIAIMIMIFAQGSPQPAVDRFISKDKYQTLEECNKSLPARKAEFIPKFKAYFKDKPVKAGWSMTCEPVPAGLVDKKGNLSGPTTKDDDGSI